jgi:hypothetical protein
LPRFAQEHQFRSKSEKLFKELKSFAQEVFALERDKQKTIGTGSNTGLFLLRLLLKGHDHCYDLSIYAWNC